MKHVLKIIGEILSDSNFYIGVGVGIIGLLISSYVMMKWAFKIKN